MLILDDLYKNKILGDYKCLVKLYLFQNVSLLHFPVGGDINMYKEILNEIYNVQESNRFKFNIQIQQEIFSLLGKVFVTMPLVPGVLNEKYQRPPSNYNKDDTAFNNYRKYKERGQKYKRLHAKCEGWNKKHILTSYQIDSNTDKIGGCAGNTERGDKISFIALDIDNFDLFRKKGYGFLEVNKWQPTLISLTGGGCHLIYRIDKNLPIKSKSYLETLGVEIIGNGKYIVLPGSIHPMTHTVYTVAKDYISPYLPLAALDIAPAPDILVKLATEELKVPTSIPEFRIQNKDLCVLAEHNYKPYPIVPKDQQSFVNLNDINDLVSPPTPSYESIKDCYDKRLIGSVDVQKINGILDSSQQLPLPSNINPFDEKLKEIKAKVYVSDSVSSSSSISNNPFEVKKNNMNCTQSINTSNADKNLSLNNPFETISKIDSERHQSINNFADERNLESKISLLPINIINLIKNPPKINRSNEDQSVLNSLAYNKWTFDEVKILFELYPIGDKYREKGRDGDSYLKLSYNNAILYISKSHSSESTSQQNFNKYSFKTMAEIYKSSEKPKWLINNILTTSENFLLAAGKGSFKSTFVLQMAVELADINCTKFLNCFDIVEENRPELILYINGENTSDQLHSKFDLLLSDYSDADKERILSKIVCMCRDDMCMFSDDIKNLEFIAAIEQFVKNNNVSLIILDNFQCFNRADENNNTEVRLALNTLTDIKTKFNAALIIVHHSGKGNSKDGSARGAASFGDWASRFITFELKNNSIKIIDIKNRNGALMDEFTCFFNQKRLSTINSDSNLVNTTQSNITQSNTPPSPNQSTSSNNIDLSLLIQVMKDLGGVCNRQKDLVINLQSLLKANNCRQTSTSYCRQLIQTAITLNIISKNEHGSNNSISYQLLNNS